MLYYISYEAKWSEIFEILKERQLDFNKLRIAINTPILDYAIQQELKAAREAAKEGQ